VTRVFIYFFFFVQFRKSQSDNCMLHLNCSYVKKMEGKNKNEFIKTA